VSRPILSATRPDVALGAEGHAQHFGRKCRIGSAGDALDEPHAPNQAVPIRVLVEAADPGRSRFQLRQADERSGVARHEAQGIVARESKSGLARGLVGAGVVAGHAADHDAAARQRGGENHVVVGQLGHHSRDVRRHLAAKQRRQQPLGRRAIGLGKDQVVADRGDARVGEPIGEVGEHGARPWPLPDRLETVLVDIDNDDRPRRLLARTQHLE
jgi:hypothetical protein